MFVQLNEEFPDSFGILRSARIKFVFELALFCEKLRSEATVPDVVDEILDRKAVDLEVFRPALEGYYQLLVVIRGRLFEIGIQLPLTPRS